MPEFVRQGSLDIARVFHGDLHHARLIAAAPDLLAALIECAAWITAELGDRLEVEPLAAARAAIAKAQGDV